MTRDEAIVAQKPVDHGDRCTSPLGTARSQRDLGCGVGYAYEAANLKAEPTRSAVLTLQAICPLARCCRSVSYTTHVVGRFFP